MNAEQKTIQQNKEKILALVYRKFDLVGLLKAINRETVYMLHNPDKDLGSGFNSFEINYSIGNSRLASRQNVIITSWELIDVAYHTVLYSRERQGKSEISEEELFRIYLYDEEYRKQNNEKTISCVSGTYRFYFYIWGMLGEQIKYQIWKKVFQNAARDMYILLDLASRSGYHYDAVITEETGVSWQVLVSSLYFIAISNTLPDRQDAVFANVNWKNKNIRNDFLKVVERYSSTPTEIRNSKLGRQHFYTKPLVRTKTGTISVSAFINLFIYEHCLYWILRDRDLQKNSYQFVIEFGRLFEKYFEECLMKYVEETNFSRIEEDNSHPRADWILHLMNHTFIIEQKSSLASLTVKQQESNIEEIEKYVKRTVLKAMRQLYKTETETIRGESIKIILIYEDYSVPEFLDDVFSLPECDVENDHRYWIVTIDEMERLLYLYAKDPIKCKAVIDEKNKRENGDILPGDAKRLDTILSMIDNNTNHHLEQKHFKRYETYAEKYLRKMIS